MVASSRAAQQAQMKARLADRRKNKLAAEKAAQEAAAATSAAQVVELSSAEAPAAPADDTAGVNLIY